MLVSFIIPAFQAESTLRYAVLSALRQRDVEVEAVIVDDGSTDATGTIADELAARDRRVRVVHQENRGLPAARNVGIATARADVIALLDSDDIVLPGYAARLGRLLERPRVGFAYCDAWVFESGKNRFWRSGILDGRAPDPLPETTAGFFEALLVRNFVYGETVMRREALDEVGGFDESLRSSEDWELWLRMLQRGWSVAHVNARLAIYRQSPGQMSKNSETMSSSQAAVMRMFGREPQPAAAPAPSRAWQLGSRAWARLPGPIRESKFMRVRYPRAVRAALAEYGFDDLWGERPR